MTSTTEPVKQTWTFVGHWEEDRIVVEYVLPGEVEDLREDTGYWEQGLWAASGTGTTVEETQARVVGEYEADPSGVGASNLRYTEHRDSSGNRCLWSNCPARDVEAPCPAGCETSDVVPNPYADDHRYDPDLPDPADPEPAAEVDIRLFDQLVADYTGKDNGNHSPDEWPLNRNSRYLLVEENRTLKGFWLSSHDSPETAADYHDSQERVANWPVLVLVDLRTGDRYQAVPSTSWLQVDPDEEGDGDVLIAGVVYGPDGQEAEPACGECGQPIPAAEPDEINPHHGPACSLHPDNEVIRLAEAVDSATP